MDPLPPGSPPQPPAPTTEGTGFPAFSAWAEDFSDRTVVMKVPGTGMTVFNRYKLQRVLGRGGMGVVWLADDLKLERPVALKFLPSLIGLDPAAVKELKTETRRGLELSHPNIVRIYDFVDDDDTAAISMEFVDGRTLSELRLNTEGGVFTTEEVSKWLLGVCDALDYAHFQRKLVHRDLKPANIMLTTRDAVAKIADFGIARSLSDTMSRLSVANMGASGTLPYMSPQQAMGERPLPTDDVYSLGATLYELFSGKPPFYRGDLPMQINSKIPPSVAERRAELDIKGREELPKVWEDAIAACLSKDPNMRPTCAGMLAEMLGLKAGTGTSRALPSFGTTQRSSSESAGKSKGALKPWMAAAAIVAAGAGAAFYLKQPAAPAAPSLVQKPAAKPAPEKKTMAKAPEPAQPKPPEVAKSEPKKAPVPVPAEPAKPTAPAASAPAPGTMTPGPVPAPTTPPVAATAPSPMPIPATPNVAARPSAAPVPAPAAPASSPPAPTTVAPAPMPALAGVVPPPPMPAAQPVPVTPAPALASSAAGPAMPAAASGIVAAPPVAMPAPTLTVPLPPGVVLTPDLISQVQTQPLVADPPTGFWTVEQIFPTAPFASYTPTGKRYLLFRTQTLLKEKGLYTSTVDGKEGKGTHNAIQLFQVRSGLRPTGLLDVPTLAALQLSAEQDNLAWVPPGGSSYSSGSSSGGMVPSPGSSRRIPVGSRYEPKIEEPGFLKRKLRGFTKDDEE
ncbi:MAG: Serine/threonine-protein kinase PknD [Prosthecobacter sp.]|nr:Serine/threonine-protein kinase PknD [Prosthecobacter sp.]